MYVERVTSETRSIGREGGVIVVVGRERDEEDVSTVVSW